MSRRGGVKVAEGCHLLVMKHVCAWNVACDDLAKNTITHYGYLLLGVLRFWYRSEGGFANQVVIIEVYGFVGFLIDSRFFARYAYRVNCI